LVIFEIIKNAYATIDTENLVFVLGHAQILINTPKQSETLI